MKQSTVWSYASFTCLAFYVVWQLCHLHWACSLRGIFTLSHFSLSPLNPIKSLLWKPIEVGSKLPIIQTPCSILQESRHGKWVPNRDKSFDFMLLYAVFFFFFHVISRDWFSMCFFEFTHYFLQFLWFLSLLCFFFNMLLNVYFCSSWNRSDSTRGTDGELGSTEAFPRLGTLGSDGKVLPWD